MFDPSSVIDDLHRESEELDLLVGELAEGAWALPTSAEGWSIAHQIAHLAWTDRAALLALTDAEAFGRETEKAFASQGSLVDEGAEEGARTAPAQLLATWRAGRSELERTLRSAPPARASPGTGRPCPPPPWPPPVSWRPGLMDRTWPTRWV